jgi:hypothetical protein
MSYDDDYDPPDEYYEEQHRRRVHGRLMSLPPGHPDEPEQHEENDDE